MTSERNDQISFRQMLDLIGEDYRSHHRDWTVPGFRTLAVYRFGVWRMGIKSPLLRFLPSRLYRMMFRFCRNVYGIELPYTAVIGRGVVIEHQGGIVIHGHSIIGDGTTIRQNCTIGIKSPEQRFSAPVIGKNVDIGAGAVILGEIQIGDGAAIGANAVVLQDVPDGALAAGVPAVIRSRTRNLQSRETGRS